MKIENLKIVKDNYRFGNEYNSRNLKLELED